MATITRIRIDHVPDDELAIQLWELTMAGDRGSDAFMRIDAEIHRRKSSQCALRLETITPSAPKSRMPVFLASLTTRPVPRIN
jgi:hypothetical protein